MDLAEDGWTVGDNLTTIAWGRAVGLQTIRISQGTWPDHEHQADHLVTESLGSPRGRPSRTPLTGWTGPRR
ncbi:hypothetical protein [Streptosporangium sp. NPDC001681]|uniref:hypothetical protein n=1 Tax=Streptosporangium sp. NPDC001681 TaxID=3154395 RepID=UPI00332582A5